MSQQLINTGIVPNDGRGDSLLEAGIKINANFTELYLTNGLPSQNSNSGKFLTTDGTSLSWATVTGGTTDYNNLINKPSIPAAQVQSDWTAVNGLGVVLNKPALFSGSYTDLTNKPSIPSSLSTLTGVTITTPSAGQILKYNGSQWINDADATAGGAGAGTVTTVSVASANGFTGTVATASSTPAITITTSITGVLKGNGTAISAATAGTDYQAPITLTTIGSSGAATFSANTLNIPQYVGNVVGPATATDNAITRFDATTGKLLQNSLVTITDLGAIIAPIAGSVIPFHYDNQAAFPSATTYHGAIAHSHSDGKMYFAHNGAWLALANASDVPAAYSATSINALSDVDTSSATPTNGQVLTWQTSTSQWIPSTVASGSGSGTVTSTSVVSANGFTGTVATSTTTPAITIATSITGILKGNATAISAATAGTDYQAPITLTTTGSSGAATFTSNTLNIPQYAGSGISWSISASDSTNYTFSGPGIESGNTTDPVLYLYKGFTYTFVNTTGGTHPFAIRVSNGGSAYTSGVSGSQTGTQTFIVPMNAPSTLYYQCTLHSGMGNVINIV